MYLGLPKPEEENNISKNENNILLKERNPKEKLGSRKLVFLHGSKRDWVNMRLYNQHDEDQADLKEVNDSPWSYANNLTNDQEEDWNNTIFTILRGALERHDKNSLKRMKAEHNIFPDDEDVMNLLFSTGRCSK